MKSPEKQTKHSETADVFLKNVLENTKEQGNTVATSLVLYVDKPRQALLNLSYHRIQHTSNERDATCTYDASI